MALVVGLSLVVYLLNGIPAIYLPALAIALPFAMFAEAIIGIPGRTGELLFPLYYAMALWPLVAIGIKPQFWSSKTFKVIGSVYMGLLLAGAFLAVGMLAAGMSHSR